MSSSSRPVPAGDSPVTAYVVDDNELSRTGLELILSARGIDVLGTGVAVAAINRIPALKPAVVLVRNTTSGLAVMTSVIRKPPPVPAFLMLAGARPRQGEHTVPTLDALTCGVQGVADISVSTDDLVLALATIAAGHMWIDAPAADGMREHIAKGPAAGPLDGLSAMEIMVGDLLTKGMSNRDIAAELHVAEKTVKNYMSRILRALHVDNRTEAALKLMELAQVG